MKNKIEEVFKAAKKEEKDLYNFFETTKNAIANERKEQGLSKYDFFANCDEYETNDEFHTEKKLTNGSQQIWISNCWVNSNNPPSNVEMRNNRFPIKCVSLWYTPYSHISNGITAEEVFEKAEKEKILYQDNEIKISMVRRNVIPYIHSVQWRHKISKHEYIMYIREKKEPSNSFLSKLEKLNQEIANAKDKKEKGKLIKKRIKLNETLYYWCEVLHEKTLKSLESQALYYFNDWYIY